MKEFTRACGPNERPYCVSIFFKPSEIKGNSIFFKPSMLAWVDLPSISLSIISVNSWFISWIKLPILAWSSNKDLSPNGLYAYFLPICSVTVFSNDLEPAAYLPSTLVTFLEVVSKNWFVVSWVWFGCKSFIAYPCSIAAWKSSCVVQPFMVRIYSLMLVYLLLLI